MATKKRRERMRRKDPNKKATKNGGSSPKKMATKKAGLFLYIPFLILEPCPLCYIFPHPIFP
jgi:hypothetical protein